jgi:hypothetical protein
VLGVQEKRQKEAVESKSVEVACCPSTWPWWGPTQGTFWDRSAVSSRACCCP